MRTSYTHKQEKQIKKTKDAYTVTTNNIALHSF